MKKITLVITLLLWGLYGMGCKDRPKVATEESKEKTAIIVFESSRVNSKVSAGFVDVIEPVEKIPLNTLIHMGGWVYDPYKILTAKGVVILSDGKQLSVSPQVGFERQDVAKALKNDGLLKSGWDASFKASLLGKGRHKLEFYSALNDGTFAPLIYGGKKSYEIEVVEK